jgi:hypothetical protein
MGGIGDHRPRCGYSACRRRMRNGPCLNRNSPTKSEDAVPDDIWAAIADHCDESQLVAMVLNIAITNFFNRINTAAKEPAGTNWA